MNFLPGSLWNGARSVNRSRRLTWSNTGRREHIEHIAAESGRAQARDDRGRFLRAPDAKQGAGPCQLEAAILQRGDERLKGIARALPEGRRPCRLVATLCDVRGRQARVGQQPARVTVAAGTLDDGVQPAAAWVAAPARSTRAGRSTATSIRASAASRLRRGKAASRSANGISSSVIDADGTAPK